MPVYDEARFGDAIVAAMLERGWSIGFPNNYRADYALDTAELTDFIGRTQGELWNSLVDTFPDKDPNLAAREFYRALDRAITDVGLLEVLRKGVQFRGKRVRVAYFKPNLVLSDAVLDNYRENRLTVVRELEYATKQADQGNRLDLTLFLNGIPIATAELKNGLTRSGIEQAKEQYRSTRDPTEPIFARRVVANFAIDQDLVFVTTQLRGAKTRFLPFNTGSGGPGQRGGAGNPRVPDGAAGYGKYATSYLWEQIWQRDTWLDLLERYVHQSRTKAEGNRTGRTTIFPRYHQWDAVQKLTAHVARHGSGHNYLIMASAGSGKSNTIAWLSHRLSSLHTLTDPDALDAEAVAKGLKPGVPVFDKIIVITDRRNLDSQLSETVRGFEKTDGLVVKIDDRHGAKSEQLAAALSRETGKIVTVTLHTFPALIDYLRRNPTEIEGGRFAIVLDEAHSSQSGDAATAVRAALREKLEEFGLDGDTDEAGAVEAKLTRKALERSHSPNLSYFAFTATPKAKTLELFGTLDTHEGEPAYRPFHTYSMRQAIEEGFILDPLRNYVTYDTYWKLVNKNPEDRKVDPAKANRLLARFALTHDSTVAQHAEVIVEHFRAHTAGRLGGRAKAMVVTASRKSAVQMSRAIKQYLGDRKYPNYGVLVAFSGSLDYEGEETSEPKENGGLSENALPKAFEYTRADDRATRSGGVGQPEYRILVVAEKYQTGFDQPLLTTMYVNKKLAGISAVQTLSRLNRTADRKSQGDLAVLDFANKTEEVQDGFRAFYEEAMALPSDPALLYTAQSRVMAPPILVGQEMQDFAAAYLAAEQKAAGVPSRWEKLHAELYRLLGPAVDRFTRLADGEEEADRQTAEEFRTDLGEFVRKYAFLSQIIPYTDPELQRLYLYGRHLINRLPRRGDGSADIGEVDLSHLRVTKHGEFDLSLSDEGPAVLPGFGDGSGAAAQAERSPLSEVIQRLNDKYGTDFTERDLLPAFREALADPKVRQAAVANPDEENFGIVFDRVFKQKVMGHVDSIADLGQQYFAADKSFQATLNRSARSAAYRLIRSQEGVED